ncbi:MAG: hypothetical protein LUQ25_00820 [Methanoregulaceae archaeon]|nr:hypothetical protein [Methanoregulaceae archaeon]
MVPIVKVRFVDDFIIYTFFGTMMFVIGLIAGYLAMNRYYAGRFVTIGRKCEEVETIVPLIAELERES